MKLTETKLKIDYIEGIKDNDPILIKKIYTSFFPSITNYIQKNDGTLEDSEDIFADALEMIFRKVNKNELHLHCSFFTYLFEICKRQWSKKRRRKKFKSCLVIEDIKLYAHVENDPLSYERRERYNLYQEKFRLLSPNSQQVLFLSIVEKKSMAEIAEEMGYKSTGYARKRKHQCLQQLRNLMQKDSRFKELVK